MAKTEKFDLVIIGGGPAGLTAGMYASRARLRVRLLEKGVSGGQINETAIVENYPGVEPIAVDVDADEVMHQLCAEDQR